MSNSLKDNVICCGVLILFGIVVRILSSINNLPGIEILIYWLVIVVLAGILSYQVYLISEKFSSVRLDTFLAGMFVLSIIALLFFSGLAIASPTTPQKSVTKTTVTPTLTNPPRTTFPTTIRTTKVTTSTYPVPITQSSPGTMAGIWERTGSNPVRYTIQEDGTGYKVTSIISPSGEQYILQSHVYSNGILSTSFYVQSTGYIVNEKITLVNANTLEVTWNNNAGKSGTETLNRLGSPPETSTVPTTMPPTLLTMATTGSESLRSNFKPDENQGYAPLTVIFSDMSTGPVENYEWNFGDGSTSDEKNPVHIYTTTGKFTVQQVIKKGDSIDFSSQIITVKEPVEAKFIVANPSQPYYTEFKFFDASTGVPVKWAWSFGDGTNSSSKDPTHVYNRKGTYTVILTVWNADGNSDTVVGIPKIQVTDKPAA